MSLLSRGARFCWRIVSIVMASLFSGVVVIALLLALRLAQGPLELGAARPLVERYLESAAPGLVEEFGALSVEWRGQDAALELTVLDVDLNPDALTGQGGEAARLRAPKVAFGFGLGPLLRRGAVEGAYLAIEGPELRMKREAGGGFDLALAERGDALALDDLIAWAPDRVAVRGGSALIEDAISGLSFEAARADLSLDFTAREEGALAADLVFFVEQRDPDGAVLAPARFEIRMRRGDATAPLVAEIAFADLDPRAALARLDRAELLAPAMTLTGVFTGELGEDGAFGPMRFVLRGADGVLDAPEIFDQPAAIARLRAEGVLDAEASVLKLDRGSLLLGGADIALDGRFALVEGGVEASGAAAISRIDIAELRRYWPKFAAKNARSWALENLKAGAARDVRLAFSFTPSMLDADPLPAGLARGDFAFEGVALRPNPDYPFLEDGVGTASFDANQLVFDVARARLGGVVAEEGVVAITGFGSPRPIERLEVETSLAADLPEALRAVMSLPPGRALADHPALDEAQGSFEGALRLAAPLRLRVRPADVDYALDATLRDVRASGLRPGVEVERGVFRFHASPGRATLEGPARVNGAPVEIDWRRFDDAEGERERLGVRGRMSENAYAAFLDDAPIAIEGPMDLAVVSETGPEGGRLIEIDADLSEAAITAPKLRWRKPIDHGGRFEARARIGPGDALDVERFALETADLRVAGAFALDEAGGLRSLEFDRFKWGRTVLQASAVRARDGALAIDLAGPSLDLAPFLARRDLFDGEGDGDGPDLRLDLELDRLAIGAGALRHVDGAIERRRGLLRELDLEARHESGGALRLAMRAGADGVGGVEFHSADLGGLLALAGGRAIEGGEVGLRAAISAQKPSFAMEGAFAAADFQVEGAPILARILTIASFDGLGDILAGEGLSFDELDAPFTLQNGVVRIERAKLVGSQLGLVATGDIDLERGWIDLEGSLAPAYSLNWALGRIPLLGQLLRGENADGALAVTFGAEGPLASPSISANPLSVIVPGFLRDLFGEDGSR